MSKYISSVQNLAIKNILHLQEKSKNRREQGLFIVDGWKETKMAIKNNFKIEAIYYSENFEIETLLHDLDDEEKELLDNVEKIKVADNVFEKIAYRGNTSKVISLVQYKKYTYKDIDNASNPIYLVIDGVEKPGNLGAILRIADAANIDAILCSDLHTDIFNPNVIRSSVGCIFSQKIIIDSKENIHSFLRERSVNIFTTSLKASKNYINCNYSNAVALVVGTEATGVDIFWEENSNQNIIIPMRGQNDSLNVSNSVAIVVFEILRQRSI